MITIDCREIKPLQQDLLVFVADKIHALPVLKSDGFALSSIDNDDTLDQDKVINAIGDFLNSVEMTKDFEISNDGDSIKIRSISDKVITAKTQEQPEIFFECTHCGYITAYEEELRTHRLIHYI